MSKSKGKSARLDQADQESHESPLEAQSRREANFEEVEAKLPKRYIKTEMGLIDRGTSR